MLTLLLVTVKINFSLSFRTEVWCELVSVDAVPVEFSDSFNVVTTVQHGRQYIPQINLSQVVLEILIFFTLCLYMLVLGEVYTWLIMKGPICCKCLAAMSIVRHFRKVG